MVNYSLFFLSEFFMACHLNVSNLRNGQCSTVDIRQIFGSPGEDPSAYRISCLGRGYAAK